MTHMTESNFLIFFCQKCHDIFINLVLSNQEEDENNSQVFILID